MMEDNKLDELFRKSLEEEEIPFEEAHWRDMKKKLEQDGKRRRDIFLWASLGGVAAMFIMTLTWWFIQPAAIENNTISKNIPDIKTQNEKPVEPAQLDRPEIIASKQQTSKKANRSGIQNDIISGVELLQPDKIIAPEKAREQVIAGNAEKVIADAPKADNNIPPANNVLPAENNVAALQDNNKAIQADNSMPDIKGGSRFKPSLILTVTAASDLSAVNSFTNIKRGSSGGLLATVSFSPRLGITTGAQLVRKIYKTGFNNYKPVSNYVFPVTPLTVDANCRVLDIPLNLNYVVWNKGDNKIEFSAGASSYFMLTEKYDFAYQNPAVRSPKHYQVRNRNKHYMGVGNIGITYERKLNKNAGIAIQPFVKLPLTEIGYGNVKLMSAGISANLNINISEIAGKRP